MWHDPATLEEWRRSGGLGEAFIDVPLELIALGLMMGIPGAALGEGDDTSRDVKWVRLTAR